MHVKDDIFLGIMHPQSRILLPPCIDTHRKHGYLNTSDYRSAYRDAAHLCACRLSEWGFTVTKVRRGLKRTQPLTENADIRGARGSV